MHWGNGAKAAVVVTACWLAWALTLNPGAALAENQPRLQLTRAEVYNQKEIPVYGYRVVRTYPHDTSSYTEGLLLTGGYLYEGTGRYGLSLLRKVRLADGRVVREHKLPRRYFGEGVALLGGRLYQLTYISNTCFVYDSEGLTLQKTLGYTTQGWGLTTDGKQLIMSNGSAALHFMDPGNLRVIRTIIVRDQAGPVGFLNELEYMEGRILANVWQTAFVAIIDPQKGKVVGWIDLTGLNPNPRRLQYPFVLNGIAYDHKTRRLLVTGKCWPYVYEIKLTKGRSR